MSPDKPVLTAAQLEVVRSSVASGAIEGWRASTDDIELLYRVAAGTITATDAVHRVQELQALKIGHADAEITSVQRDWSTASWDDYIYPGTAVLVNRLNIRDSLQLEHVAGIVVAILTIEAVIDTPSVPDPLDGAQLRALHRQLAQDLYDWAGNYRSVPMGKQWSQFAPVETIATCLERAARVVAETDWPETTDNDFADRAAIVYSWLNYAHPFRDLNGRVTRIFMDYVAAQADRVIDYSKVPGDVWIQRSAFTVPDQGQTRPAPEYMTPVFRAVSSRQ